MAKFLIQLFLWIFLIGSLQPTPLYAAEAIQTQVKAAAATDEPSLLDQAIQFFTPEDPQLQPKEKEDSGFWDSVGNFLGLNDPAEEKGEALATEMLPHKEQAPKGKKMPQPKRVKELTQKRTANAKFYELADGRQQVEISSDPIHYKDGKGNWKKIDTRIQSTNQSGFNMKNDKNTFQSFFGKKSDQLVRFQLGKRHLTLGVQETKKQTLTPNREDNVVTYPEVWEHADLKYTVLPKSLKEEIVLKKAPQDPTYRFSLKLGGVEAKERKDGSIAFVAKGTGQVMFVISKPFMIDSKDDPESPYGKVYSDQVTQSVEQKGAHITVTVKADPKWLASEKRQYPVTIDPTITLQPTPATSKDAYIMSGSSSNFGDLSYVSVGTTSTQKARGLVQFDLSSIPERTPIDSAVLGMYYDQTHTTNANDVELEVYGLNQAWDENTVTWDQAQAGVNWKQAGGTLDSEVAHNQEIVDDSDTGKVTYRADRWPASTNTTYLQYAYKKTYRANKGDAAGDTFTWIPHLTEDGEYQVEAHYVPASDRTTVPYTIHYKGGKKTVNVNQATGSGGVWTPLGSHPFTAGTSHQIVLGDSSDPSKASIADAIRLTKYARAVKKANTNHEWHYYSVRNLAQRWVNDPSKNFGMLLKAKDEGKLGQGGPRYYASERYDETNIRPKLVVTYGDPGVTLEKPTKIYATGAELNWSKYTGSDFVEYQVHRSVNQDFQPSPSTLVAPLQDPNTVTYTDTTAEPTPLDESGTEGKAYYYQVVVKTKKEELRSNSVITRLPKAGRTKQIIRGAKDTTLASAKPDTNLNTYNDGDKDPWLQVGWSATYGKTRPVLKFDLSGIPSNADIVDADLDLWQWSVNGDGPGDVDVHALNRSFTEKEATWNRASSATAWSKAGGDYDSTVIDTIRGANLTNDLHWRTWNVDSIVQDWVSGAKENYGFLIKPRTEGTGSNALFLSSESGDADHPAGEALMRPRMEITYIEPTAANTYYIPQTPARMISGEEYTVGVTLTNTTKKTWKAADHALSYHWKRPDDSEVTTGGNPVKTPLSKDLAPGESVTLKAKVKTPNQSDAGNKREAYVLDWDIQNTTDHTWLSETDEVETLDQKVTLEEPTSDQLGLEKFYQYAGKNTGAGSTVMVNQYAGNVVFGYNPFSNPSRGLATFLRMTYNSLDTSDSAMGYGWSLSATSLMRLGSALDLHPKGQEFPREVTLTDGDGTSHIFKLQKPDDKDPATWYYQKPAGVHFYLQKDGSKKERQWVMTRPDRTQFYFDEAGFLSAIVDKNGNELLFTYEEKKSSNKPTKFLKYITDPTGRQTLTLDYYQKGDDYTYFDSKTNTKTQDKKLNNPKIIDQVKSITDISGRKITFTYSDKGLMREMVDGAGSEAAKTFGFEYDATNTNKNTKLVKITDPRGHETHLDYYMPPDADTDNINKWRIRTLTDRLGGKTKFEYTAPDDKAPTIESTVTDAKGKQTTYLMDRFGRPEKTTNAKGETTKLSWDHDHNVTRLEEANGAVSTWTYDSKTGYPLTVKDAEANKNGTEATTLYYQTHLSGYVADLVKKKSPEGREWSFAYDAQGNLKSVTDPMGNATPTVEGDYTTTYTYDSHGQLLTATDANKNKTTYSDYHPTGYPETITDALGHATTTVYDERGHVVSMTDAKGKKSEYHYDLFGRPLDSKVPKDQAKGKYIETPAPVYDKNDNVTKETAPNGAVTTYSYDEADQMVATIAPKDTADGPERKTTFAYDLVGNLLKQTEPKGNLTPDKPDDFVTKYAYDDIYQLTSVTNADGDQISYEYDNVGNVVTVIDPKKNQSKDPAAYTTKVTYDLNHQVIKETDAKGHSTRRAYDLDGNPTAVTDQEGVTITLIYDERGLVKEVKVPHKDGVDRITRYAYDEVGNRTKVFTPRSTEADNPEAFVQVTKYDALNRVKEQIFPHDGTKVDPEEKMTFTYDEVGNQVKVSAPPSHGQTVRNETTTDYFDNGWIQSSTDPWDIVTSYDYNELGQQTKRTLTSAGGSSSRTMGWSYYPDGKLKAKSDDGIPVGQEVVLVDNSDSQNVEAVSKDTEWKLSSSVKNHVGYNYTYNHKGTGADTFTWKLNIPSDGNYEVWVSYQKYKDRATNAPYTIEYDGGKDTVRVNQNVASGSVTEWKKLGTYAFKEGNSHKITLSDDADGIVVADAVKLVRDHSGDKNDQHKQFDYEYDANGNLVKMTDTSVGAKADTYVVTYNGLNQVEKVEEKKGSSVQNTTSYTYDPNGNPLTRTHDKEVAEYAYDPRDLVSQVTNKKSATDTKPKVTKFTYTPRGQKQKETKANGNTVDYTYTLDGLLKHQVEKKSNGTLVNEHTIEYNANGHRIQDTAKKMNADNHADYIHHVLTYEYDPRDRVTKKTKSTPGGSVVDTEIYVHDANNNVIEQTVDGTKTTFHYDRNRLLSAHIGGTTAAYNYDPFGRLDRVTAAGKQIEKYKYDGFDRVQEQSKIQEDGSTKTTKYSYDPLDRTTSRTEGSKTTDFNYLGLSGEIFSEEVAGQITKSYQYSPWGERLSMVKHKSDGTEEDSFYGYNPHTDVEVLTDEKGDSRATYGYTAYGKNDEKDFTGVDKPDPQTPDQEPYNVYRFNSKRWDASTGDYDMGFRSYNPGLNRFLTRDMYNGAGADMNLGMDPWTMNRYAFAGGNPISMVELDGHVPMEVKDGHITAEEYHQATGHTIGGVKTPWKPAMSRAKPRIEQREVGKAVNDYKELLSQNILPMDHWNWIANRSDELEQRFGLRVANQFVFETNTIRLSLSPETAVDPSAQGNILVGSGLISSIAIRYKGGGGSGGVGKLVSRGFVDPGDVRFTQDSIKYQFGDKSGTVDDLIKGLKSGKINPRDIPPIRIFEMNGKIYSLDNRRLYAFKQAGLEVPYEIADPRVVRKQIGTPENMNGWKFTTTNDGQSIRLRR